MSGIFSGFEALINTIMGPVRFLGYVIETLIDYIDIIVSMWGQIYVNITTLPSWLINFVTVSAGFILISVFLGRSTGK